MYQIKIWGLKGYYRLSCSPPKVQRRPKGASVGDDAHKLQYSRSDDYINGGSDDSPLTKLAETGRRHSRNR